MCRGDAQEKLLLLYRLHLPPALPLLLDEEDVEIGVEADQFFEGSTVESESNSCFAYFNKNRSIISLSGLIFDTRISKIALMLIALIGFLMLFINISNK